jgi:hypothetical protein
MALNATYKPYVDPTGTLKGRNAAQLAADYWKWVFSLKRDEIYFANGHEDDSRFPIKQGPVWFLGQDWSVLTETGYEARGPITRRVTLPAGTPVGVMVNSYESDPIYDEDSEWTYQKGFEAAAEHEVVEQVTPEQQAELLKTQEAGAEAEPEATETTTEGGEAGSDESKES